MREQAFRVTMPYANYANFPNDLNQSYHIDEHHYVTRHKHSAHCQRGNYAALPFFRFNSIILLGIWDKCNIA